MGNAMAVSAITIAIIMLSTWLLSLAIKNASIVDIVWGLGFAVTSWVLALTIDGDPTRQALLAFMVGLWGVRLGSYLAKRNLGHGEDWRYKLMRKKRGSNFGMISLVTVYFKIEGYHCFRNQIDHRDQIDVDPQHTLLQRY